MINGPEPETVGDLMAEYADLREALFAIRNALPWLEGLPEHHPGRAPKGAAAILLSAIERRVEALSRRAREAKL